MLKRIHANGKKPCFMWHCSTPLGRNLQDHSIRNTLSQLPIHVELPKPSALFPCLEIEFVIGISDANKQCHTLSLSVYICMLVCMHVFMHACCLLIHIFELVKELESEITWTRRCLDACMQCLYQSLQACRNCSHMCIHICAMFLIWNRFWTSSTAVCGAKHRCQNQGRATCGVIFGQ
jgi:hypothetical protein